MTEPQTIGKFQVEAVIGRGGFATVYRAYDPALKRRVAIKMPHAHLVGEPGFRTSFAQEAQLAAALTHPHILTIYEVGEHEGVPFIAMELLDGLPLNRWLAETRPAPALLWSTLIEVGQALDHAHSRGIMHRDVKPANVLVVPGRGAVLSDFGIARSYDASAHISGAITGTPAYMAPEQALGQQSSAATDVYALSVMVYEIVAGRPPFTGDTPVAMLNQHATRPPPDPRSFRPALPAAVASLLLQGLDKTPTVRPKSAEQFMRSIAAGMGALPGGNVAARPGRRATSPAPPPRRPGWLFPALAVLVLLLAIVAVVQLRTPSPAAAPAPAALTVPRTPTARITAAPPATERPALALQPTVPTGGQNAYIEYILDASNSMLEKLGGQSKLVLAQQALAEHLRNQPVDANFGLRVYGHRMHYTEREKSCQDVELVAPVEAGQGERIAEWLGSMQAQGLSPIGLALREAGKDFSSAPGRDNRIVLIGDGKESCGVDPCAEVRRLKAAGVDVVVNVIGLNVSADAQAELECVAKQSGGKYQGVKQAQDLPAALGQVTQLSARTPEPAASPAGGAGQTPTPAAAPATPSPEPATAAPTFTPRPTTTPSPTMLPTVVVARDTINLRSGPGVIYPVIARLKAGTALTVISSYDEPYTASRGPGLARRVMAPFGEKVIIATVAPTPFRRWFEVCCAPSGIQGWILASGVSNPDLIVPTAIAIPPTPKPTRKPPTATRPPVPTTTPVPPTPAPQAPAPPKPPEPQPGKPPVPTPVP